MCEGWFRLFTVNYFTKPKNVRTRLELMTSEMRSKSFITVWYQVFKLILQLFLLVSIVCISLTVINVVYSTT